MGAGRRAAKAIAAYLADGERRWPMTPDAVETYVPPAPLQAVTALEASEPA